MFRAISAIALMIASVNGYAQLTSIKGKITILEATYMPKIIPFYMDAGTPACPAGRELKWANPDDENNKAVYSLLLAAYMSGKSVTLYIDGPGCTGKFIHIRDI